MNFAPKAEPIPITHNADDVAVITGTRIPIDTVIYTFLDGSTPEQIAQKFPILELGQIYLIIAYYLNHRAEVDVYLAERHTNSDRVRSENESHSPSIGTRERLLARKHQVENNS
jgi:uncharacterized protein (DUF433 family)